MGCESIVNMPVRWGSRVLGTVNLTHEEAHYGEADLPRIEAWAQLAVPAFLEIVSAAAPGRGPTPPSGGHGPTVLDRIVRARRR
jgi:hypothetical protein